MTWRNFNVLKNILRRQWSRQPSYVGRHEGLRAAKIDTHQTACWTRVSDLIAYRLTAYRLLSCNELQSEDNGECCNTFCMAVNTFNRFLWIVVLSWRHHWTIIINTIGPQLLWNTRKSLKGIRLGWKSMILDNFEYPWHCAPMCTLWSANHAYITSHYLFGGQVSDYDAHRYNNVTQAQADRAYNHTVSQSS